MAAAFRLTAGLPTPPSRLRVSDRRRGKPCLLRHDWIFDVICNPDIPVGNPGAFEVRWLLSSDRHDHQSSSALPRPLKAAGHSMTGSENRPEHGLDTRPQPAIDQSELSARPARCLASDTPYRDGARWRNSWGLVPVALRKARAK